MDDKMLPSPPTEFQSIEQFKAWCLDEKRLRDVYGTLWREGRKRILRIFGLKEK